MISLFLCYIKRITVVNNVTFRRTPNKTDGDSNQEFTSKMPAIPKFIVLSEQLRGRMFELNQDEITIGRSDDRTITLKDPTVSTLHCKITRNGDKTIIVDAGSTNGTKINGEPLTGEYELQNGDTVKIGAFDLLYDSEDKTMTMSIQKTQTGIDINAASTTQTIKSVASTGFTERKQSSGLSNKLMIAIVVLLALIFLALLAMFVKNFMDSQKTSFAPARTVSTTQLV